MLSERESIFAKPAASPSGKLRSEEEFEVDILSRCFLVWKSNNKHLS